MRKQTKSHQSKTVRKTRHPLCEPSEQSDVNGFSGFKHAGQKSLDLNIHVDINGFCSWCRLKLLKLLKPTVFGAGSRAAGEVALVEGLWEKKLLVLYNRSAVSQACVS